MPDAALLHPGSAPGAHELMCAPAPSLATHRGPRRRRRDDVASHAGERRKRKGAGGAQEGSLGWASLAFGKALSRQGGGEREKGKQEREGKARAQFWG